MSDVPPLENGHVWECGCDECRDWDIAMGKAQGAAEERARIVEWLHGRAAQANAHGERYKARGMLQTYSAFDEYATSTTVLAEGIEHGDHIKQETKPNE